MSIKQKALSLILATSLVVSSFAGITAFAETEDGTDNTTKEVSSLEELKDAMANSSYTEIDLQDDIKDIPDSIHVSRAVTIDGRHHTLTFSGLDDPGKTDDKDDGLVIETADTKVENLTIDAGVTDPKSWVGTYAIQVFNTSATLENITATGGNGGILVNGSTVTLAGKIDVSGNGFGGIEVSKGSYATNDPELAVSEDGAILKNDSEVFAKPTVWEDDVDEGTIAEDVIKELKLTSTIVTVNEEGKTQPQYYLNIENSHKPYFELNDVPTDSVLTENKVTENDDNGQISEFDPEGKTPIQVSLKANNADYSKVRIEVEITSDNSDGIQLLAYDEQGKKWYNIVKSGWGTPEGFELADATTPVYLVANQAGTYTATIKLVNVTDNKAVLATTEASITAAKGTVFPTKEWKGPAGDPQKPLAAKTEQSFVFPFETTGNVNLSELQLDIYLGNNTGDDRNYNGAVQFNIPAELSDPTSSLTVENLNTALDSLGEGKEQEKANTILLLKAAGVVFEGDQVSSVENLKDHISYQSDGKKGTWTITLDTTQLLRENNADEAIEFLVMVRTSDDDVHWGNNNYVTYGEDTKAYRYTIAKQKTSDEVSDAIDQLSESSTSEQVSEVINSILVLPDEDRQKLDSNEITKLEEIITSANSNVTKDLPAPNTTEIADETAKLPPAVPTVTGLLLAAGVRGNESENTIVKLTATQKAPTGNSLIAFDLTLTKQIGSGEAEEIHETLPFPVTITIQLPANFVKQSNYAYSIQHGSETIPLTITGTSGHYIGTFTTSSFSTFSIVKTYNGGNNDDDNDNHHNGESGSSTTTTPSTPTPSQDTFASDTTQNFSVNGTYTFKITSKNGQIPNVVIGTSGVFDTTLVKVSGNDYFFKITAIGAPGANAGIYINSNQRLLIATVGSNPNYAKLDTGNRLNVKTGKTYQFKVTAAKKPTFVCGNGSVFRVDFNGSKGNDYFFKVTAIGKAGNNAGFYINGEKTPRTVGTIVS